MTRRTARKRRLICSHPTMVMDLLRSEAFGTQKRHDKIDAEGDGDSEAEGGSSICVPLTAVERAGVKGEHEKRACAEHHKDEVGHTRVSC
jgi:hypothetical protein